MSSWYPEPSLNLKHDVIMIFRQPDHVWEKSCRRENVMMMIIIRILAKGCISSAGGLGEISGIQTRSWWSWQYDRIKIWWWRHHHISFSEHKDELVIMIFALGWYCKIWSCCWGMQYRLLLQIDRVIIMIFANRRSGGYKDDDPPRRIMMMMLPSLSEFQQMTR